MTGLEFTLAQDDSGVAVDADVNRRVEIDGDVADFVQFVNCMRDRWQRTHFQGEFQRRFLARGIDGKVAGDLLVEADNGGKDCQRHILVGIEVIAENDGSRPFLVHMQFHVDDLPCRLIYGKWSGNNELAFWLVLRSDAGPGPFRSPSGHPDVAHRSLGAIWAVEQREGNGVFRVDQNDPVSLVRRRSGCGALRRGDGAKSDDTAHEGANRPLATRRQSDDKA